MCGIYERAKLGTTLGSTSAFSVFGYVTETEDYAIAVSTDRDVGVTWNPSPGRLQGYPHTYKHQQWFILPRPIGKMVLSASEIFVPTVSDPPDGRE